MSPREPRPRRSDGAPPVPDAGKSPREYGHSSGDRNTKKDEQDWPRFDGGRQRDATPSGPPSRDARH